MLGTGCIAAAAGVLLSFVAHESRIAFTCSGCEAKVEVRHFHWQANGQGVWGWYTGGGQIAYGSAAAAADNNPGECIGADCHPNPEDLCVSSHELVITGGGTLTRFVSDASGCATWAGLTDDQKKLVAKANSGCDNREVQDEIKGYNNTTCTTGGAAGPEKVVLAVWCSACTVVD